MKIGASKGLEEEREGRERGTGRLVIKEGGRGGVRREEHLNGLQGTKT